MKTKKIFVLDREGGSISLVNNGTVLTLLLFKRTRD